MIERYTFGNASATGSPDSPILYCLGTGLAFYSPYLFWIAICSAAARRRDSGIRIIGTVFRRRAIVDAQHLAIATSR